MTLGIFIKMLYELEKVKIYLKQSKKDIKIEWFLVGTISKQMFALLSLCNWNNGGKRFCEREK